MLVVAVAENFHELLQYCSVAAIAPLGESRGIMIVTIYIAFMLIVRVLGTEDSWTNRASEMFDVIFAIQGRYIGAS